VLARNDLTWNRLGGITVTPFEAQPPRENRMSANRFDENGVRPIVLDLDVVEPNTLISGSTGCSRVSGAANGGILPPRITDVKMETGPVTARVLIRGRSCPGEVIELYQSYITAGVGDRQQADAPLVRSGSTKPRETLVNQEREMGMPSIGEFNYLGAATTDAAGTFEAVFTIPVTVPDTRREDGPTEELEIWASTVLRPADPSQRAFSATATDAAGNTSEMSIRRRAD
jgi:hypothetical protein